MGLKLGFLAGTMSYKWQFKTEWALQIPSTNMNFGSALDTLIGDMKDLAATKAIVAASRTIITAENKGRTEMADLFAKVKNVYDKTGKDTRVLFSALSVPLYIIASQVVNHFIL